MTFNRNISNIITIQYPNAHKIIRCSNAYINYDKRLLGKAIQVHTMTPILTISQLENILYLVICALKDMN